MSDPDDEATPDVAIPDAAADDAPAEPVVPRPGRLRRAWRWATPSIGAALVGGAVAGLGEGVGASGLVAIGVTTGFVAMLVVPVLLVLGLLLRGVVAAWNPKALMAQLVEEGGGAPVLAAWVVTAVLGLGALGALVVQGTWTIARLMPFTLSNMLFLYPIIVAGLALLLVGLSRPAALVIGRGTRRLDARWRLSPRRIVIVTVAGISLALAIAWFVAVRPRLGPLDTSPVHAPAAGMLAAVGVGMLRRARPWLVRIATGIVGLTAATAVTATYVQPVTTLEVWGDQPLAGLAIESIFDLETMRARVSLAQFRPVPRPGAPHPDIILITVDTVRADHTPPYGGVAVMPTFAGLAKRGTVFEWAFSPSNVTRRSIPSIVTGLSADRVKGRVVGWALRLDPRHVLLAERLRAGGYATAGFMCCDGFWGEKAKTGLQRGLDHLVIERDGAELGRQAAAWLTAREATRPTEPLFVWIHILEPHSWISIAPEPASEADRSRQYDRALGMVDPVIAELLVPFAARTPERAPIVMITADHGEALGEHGTPYHSTDLYNSQTRVPLVVVGPGVPAARVTETVSLTGVTPTVLELAGFDPDDDRMDGISFAALATGQRASRDDGVAYAAMIKDRSNPGNVTALVQGRYKLVRVGARTELYDIHADPRELNDLADTKPDVRAKLEAALDARNEAARASPFE